MVSFRKKPILRKLADKREDESTEGWTDQKFIGHFWPWLRTQLDIPRYNKSYNKTYNAQYLYRMHFYVNKKRAKLHISDCVRISNNKKTSQNVMLLIMNYEQELQEIKKK